MKKMMNNLFYIYNKFIINYNLIYFYLFFFIFLLIVMAYHGLPVFLLLDISSSIALILAS